MAKAYALALVICAAAAALEGMAAGGDVRARFSELRLPPYSPPLALWIGIGAGYYAMCFGILIRLLSLKAPSDGRAAALTLTVAIMIVNAGWGVLFFRRKNLRASYLAFFPYGILVATLAMLVARIDAVSALLLLPYLLYLIYATWWGREVWRLNAARP